MKRAGDRFISFLVLVASVCTVLLILEVVLRAAGWERRFERIERVEEGTPRCLDVRTLRANAVVRHVSGEFDVTYRSNEHGYYDRPWAQAPPPGALRVGFFGDSFTMGHGVGTEAAFPRIIEPILSAKAGCPVETLNFGVWGSGTLDEREYIEDAFSLCLDHVVLCVFINDVFDNERYLRERRAGTSTGRASAGDGASPPGPVGRLKDWLNRRSRLAAFVLERTKNLRDALGLVTYPLEAVFTGQADDRIEATAAHIAEIADLLAGEGINFTVVYLPARVQSGSVRIPDDFDLDRPNRLLGSLLPEIDFIDLTSGLREFPAREIWFREGHLNERGHMVVAGHLSARLDLRPRLSPATEPGQ